MYDKTCGSKQRPSRIFNFVLEPQKWVFGVFKGSTDQFSKKQIVPLPWNKVCQGLKTSEIRIVRWEINMNACWVYKDRFFWNSNLTSLLVNTYMILYKFVFLTSSKPNTPNFKVSGRNLFIYFRNIDLQTINTILKESFMAIFVFLSRQNPHIISSGTNLKNRRVDPPEWIVRFFIAIFMFLMSQNPIKLNFMVKRQIWKFSKHWLKDSCWRRSIFVKPDSCSAAIEALDVISRYFFFFGKIVFF